MQFQKKRKKKMVKKRKISLKKKLKSFLNFKVIFKLRSASTSSLVIDSVKNKVHANNMLSISNFPIEVNCQILLNKTWNYNYFVDFINKILFTTTSLEFNICCRVKKLHSVNASLLESYDNKI